MEKQWDVPIVHDRQSQIRRDKFEGKSREEALKIGSSWIAGTGLNRKLIYGFDSYDPKSVEYKCSNHTAGVDGAFEKRKVVSESPYLILDCTVESDYSISQKILRVDDGKVVWEFDVQQFGKRIMDIIYSDDDYILVNFGLGVGGIVYGFLDSKTGRLIKKTDDVLAGANYGFSRPSMSLYVARYGMDRSKESFIMHYDYETNSFTDLAVIPNEFSGQKMTISIQPEMTFGNERYLVLSISSGGRGITFAGFIVIDTRTGEYLYKDYFEGGPPFKFVANDEGDLVVVKYDNDSRASIVTHLRFN